MLRLNIGCGRSKLPGFVNIDINPEFKPDLVLDIANEDLKYDDGEVDQIVMFHTIEHIPKKQHQLILAEFNRLLKDPTDDNDGGSLIITYPEFRICSQNFINNHRGQRDYWEATILGRGNNSFELHRTLMDTKEFSQTLKLCGFDVRKSQIEPDQEHNMMIQAFKSHRVFTRETVLAREIFT